MTTRYSIVCVILLIALIILGLLKTSYVAKKVKKVNISMFTESEIYNILIQVLITILGVVAAIYLTNSDMKLQEKITTKNLLVIVEDDLNTTDNLIETFYLPVYEHEEQRAVSFEEIYHSTPLSESYAIDTLLQNDGVRNTVNYYSYRALNDMRRSLADHFEALSNIKDDDELYNELKALSGTIKLTTEIIENEIAYQNNDIKKKEMKEKVNGLYEEYFLNLNNQ